MLANCIKRRKKEEYTCDLHKICGTPVTAVAHSTHNPHLIPIFSLCFCRARSAIDCDANWTYASPEARPISSANRAIPLGTICIPVNPHTNPQNITINPTSLSQQSANYITQSLHQDWSVIEIFSAAVLRLHSERCDINIVYTMHWRFWGNTALICCIC